ncbi:rhodanese-like domain-containing protein [Pseudooctadecabacter jejudonensis]|uniref:Rhodanese-like domain protein n=1 Tax=Pseudooctadecabacter jejudonensis TaxID=1391910 RepID=A0A1Y5S5D7_9RHOB|nr:rhodanese-like domain-containing protein [Pseudooctadecabacter jejudonensis]SLN30170.1 Rhodanese-like domain protein [Pseudooctadecabacter jejudonensis]
MGHTAVAAITAVLLAWSTAAVAQDVRITTFKGSSTFTLNGETFTVIRNPDTSAVITGDFARTSRACPPDCLQPMVAATGVATLGELEVLAFLETAVTEGRGLLIDARASDDYATGAIPGSVNIPAITLSAENRFRKDILRALGAVDINDETMTFDGAMDLTFYGGGAWSSDAPDAISYLIEAGYPPSKLRFYRGGLQAWLSVGLSILLSPNG